MTDCSFLQRAVNMHPTVETLFGSYMAGATLNYCHLGAFCVHHTPCTVSRHFMQTRHIRRVHACIAVTSQLHFWKNDRDFLRVTAIAMRKSAAEVTKDMYYNMSA